ncbi:class I SAM-dependent methyltransferase [Gammaproteobacteria bacterium]|nr:class I SAM-dependent methyltransferase [Gammaproteobacteria bacterium]
MNEKATASIEAVQAYWNQHVDDWKIASHASCTPEFFLETELYRFEKLHYLNDCIPFGASAGKKVIEIGCGIGNDLTRFAKSGAKVTGVDLSGRSIELSKANFEQRALTGEFLQMNGEHLDIDDNCFDIAYCHTVLQFTPHPDRMVAEIHRILKPGGQAIIMALNSRSWLMLMHRLLKTRIDYLDSPVYNLFSITEFQHLLAPFTTTKIITERFPVPTKVHTGLKAWLYNALFVDVFNTLPKRLTSASGHHLLAYAQKAD